MKVANDVLQALDACTTIGRQLTMPQMDPKLYKRVNTVLEAAGGKWNRKARAHVFDTDAALAIEALLLTGEITMPRDFGCFYSPPAVVDRVMALARPRSGEHACEPSAGQGALACAMAGAGCRVDCWELLASNCAILERLNLPGAVHLGDFLQARAPGRYDLICMNPPFGKQADTLHVLQALEWLRPGGRLVAVMAAGITFRMTALARRLRERIACYGGTIDALPDGSFRSSGTEVMTVLVHVELPA